MSPRRRGSAAAVAGLCLAIATISARAEIAPSLDSEEAPGTEVLENLRVLSLKRWRPISGDLKGGSVGQWPGSGPGGIAPAPYGPKRKDRPVDPTDAPYNDNLPRQIRNSLHSWMLAREVPLGGTPDDAAIAACAASQVPLFASSADPTIYVDGELTAAARKYLAACFVSAFDPRVEAGIQRWVMAHAGALLANAGDDGGQLVPICSMTFMSPTRAVTARHCVAHALDDDGALGALVVAGVSKAGGALSVENWQHAGVRVVLDGRNDALSNQRAAFQRDYVVLAPASGAWPVAAGAATLKIDSGSDVFRVAHTLLTWVRVGDLTSESGVGASQALLPLGDRMPSCLVGHFQSGSAQALHGCQSVRSSSGGMLVRFDPIGAPGQTRVGRGFGIHVGRSDIDPQTESQVNVNLAITLPASVLAEETLARRGP